MKHYKVSGIFSGVIEATDEDDARDTLAAAFQRLDSADFDDGTSLDYVEAMGTIAVEVAPEDS